MTPKLKEQIQSLIAKNPVFLFMKGSKELPQCGYSKQVVGMLNSLTQDYQAFDVLSDFEVREGIKEFSNWPTIPQLYINGEFVGGCDIVTEMFESGELAKMLNIKKATSAPKISLSPGALQAFTRALNESDEKLPIRVRIGAEHSHGLEFDAQKPDDFSITFENMTLLIDPYSANHAENLTIDFEEEGMERGFVFSFPSNLKANSPKSISPEEVKYFHDEGDDFLLVDVRTKDEWDLANISFAKRLEDLSEDFIANLPKDKKIIFHCHHGKRSFQEGQKWCQEGFINVYNLEGGIAAWSKNVDSSVKTY